MKDTKTRAEIKAESREELERRVAAGIPHGSKGDKMQETSSTFGGHVVPVRDDTEGHVEGPVGTWNTSGTEVAKPVALERDRYDEQNRNNRPSHGMTPADQVYRRAQAGDEAVLATVTTESGETAVTGSMPQNNQTVIAAERGVPLETAVEEQRSGTEGAPAKRKTAARKGAKKKTAKKAATTPASETPAK